MIIAGNWKMNLFGDEAAALVHDLDRWLDDGFDGSMIVFPPAVLIPGVINALDKTTLLQIGGQDCHAEQTGAHTGDISAAMLADAGCRHVLVGHSERRQHHGETDAIVQAKAKAALQAGLNPMVCIGEDLSEREAGSAFDVVTRQINESIPSQFGCSDFTIAYEPLWAIGTGRVADPDDIAAMHQHIRTVLKERHESLAETAILYGGSVKSDNAAAILGLDDVDGALVGGASLRAEDFIAIASAGRG